MSNSPKLTLQRGTAKGSDPYGESPGDGYARAMSPAAGYTISDRDAAHWTVASPDWYKWDDLTNGGVVVGDREGNTVVRTFNVKPQGDTRVDDVLACEHGQTTQSANYSAEKGTGNEWTVTETQHAADNDQFYVFAHHKVGSTDTTTVMTDPVIRNDGN